MNSIKQTNLNERDINYNNQISLSKSEKFQDSINHMKLMMWNKFLSGVVNNLQMTKKEICHRLGFKKFVQLILFNNIINLRVHFILRNKEYVERKTLWKQVKL
jgi:hypothetical protein